jgi:hypothetical protein
MRRGGVCCAVFSCEWRTRQSLLFLELSVVYSSHTAHQPPSHHSQVLDERRYRAIIEQRYNTKNLHWLTLPFLTAYLMHRPDIFPSSPPSLSFMRRFDSPQSYTDKSLPFAGHRVKRMEMDGRKTWLKWKVRGESKGRRDEHNAGNQLHLAYNHLS